MYVKLKKKYGQNFLIDDNIIYKIISFIERENLNILEIGPGDGRLTEGIISKNPKRLDLVEIDKELVGNLHTKFKNYNFITIINEDVLKHNLKKNYDLVISNLPYNISSQVLIKLSIMPNTPKEMVLMFQKEFASKLLNKDLNSINSIVNCFFKIKSKFHVGRNCFRPIPKIDSTVLRFVKLNKNLIRRDEIDNFIEFKRYLFSYKRKTLGNLLKEFNLNDQSKLDIRAEKLKLNDLINIFREIKP